MEHSYLEQMKFKKVPGKQKDIFIRFHNKTEEPEQEKEIEPEITDDKHRKKAVEIVDLRKSMNIDRDLILKRLREKNALTVVFPVSTSKMPSHEFMKEVPKQFIAQKTDTSIVIEPPTDAAAPVSIIGDDIDWGSNDDENDVTTVKKVEERVIESESSDEEAIPATIKEPEVEEEQKEPEPETEPETAAKTVTIKRPRKNKGKEQPTEKLTKTGLATRLPKPEKLVVKTSPYYMNNRRQYVQKIRQLFHPYTEEIEKASETASCNSGDNVDFSLLTHQKVVRDYLNLYTPYRGILLYHGLGSGKSCTSIAVAEGMKTEKQVILMTPASLKSNFFAELKKCGDHLYRKNQYWEFVRIEGQPGNIDLLEKALNIPRAFIEKQKGAWLVDVKKPANFGDLTSGDQEAIDEQLDVMIRAKYQDINYNGLNPNIMNRLTENNKKNPFDNKVVIIDEAHNLVSRIVNKIKRANSINYRLYDYLMKAQNCRVVMLSGTPIINYPNEIAIMFNILRGAIKTWTIPVATKTERKMNRDTILEMFAKDGLTTYDFVEYSDNKITITRNPYGFINMKKREHRGGNNNDLMDNYIGGKSTTKKHSERVSSSRATKKKHASVDMEKAYTIKNGVIKINPSRKLDIEEDESVDYYNRVLKDVDMHDGGMVGGEDEFAKYSGVKLDETGNISDEEFLKQIKKILGHNQIEVMDGLIKVEYNKALPDIADAFLNMFVDTESKTMKNDNLFKRRILGLTSYFRSAQEKLLPSFVMTDSEDMYHIERVEMSDHQFGEYIKIRKGEIEDEKKSRLQKQKQAKTQAQQAPGKNEDVYTMSSTYRIFSRAACNYVFPSGIERPHPDTKEKEGDEDEEDAKERDESELIDAVSVRDTEESALSPIVSEPKYAERIQAALASIKEGDYLQADKLVESSPKFVKILENLKNPANSGLHLLYSQFRTIEGIGIIKLILEANGFAEFKIKSTGGGWAISDSGDSSDSNQKPKFVLYTGTETAEEKEIIRNIYNGAWAMVPKNIADELRKKAANNNNGEIIKIFMITSSGAEGINLKNTRFVHIVEPYWHNVRLEQVIGRARRICSHMDLPEELRTVQVFLYISMFSEKQMTDRQNIEVMIHDLSRIEENKSVTTDESLFEIANIKTDINSNILKSIKESAIDCTLYKNSENLVCYGSSMGKITSNQFLSYPTLEMDEGEREDLNVKAQRIKLTETKPIDGVVYAADKKTGELYDLAKYKNGQMIKVGMLVKRGKKVEVVLDKK